MRKDEKTTEVGAAHISQPACTAIQLALTDLLYSWGIRPTAVAGHSSGEISAAYAAGVLTFKSCMTIAYHRGRLIPVLKQRHPDLRGSMMAVGGSKDDIEPLVSQLTAGQVRIACYNSPTSLTISGDEAAIDELKDIVEQKQLFNRKLFVDTAYHSHHMNLIAKDYQQSIQGCTLPLPTETRFYSSLVGRRIDGKELEATYWVQNLTCAVRFSEAVQSMLEPVGEQRTGVNMLVELGPHAALQGPLKQILKAVGGDAAKVPYASALLRKRDAVETALEVAGALFTKGAVLDFDAINYPKPGSTPTLLTDLPLYPWNRSSRYWHESRMTLAHKHRSAPRSDILGTVANYSSDLEPTWRNIVRLDDLPWLQHHRVQSLTVFPLSGYIAMAVEAAKQRALEVEAQVDRYELRDVTITAPVIISDEDVEMTTTLRPSQEGFHSRETEHEFTICSWTRTKGWTEHCKGLVAAVGEESNEVDGERRAKDFEATIDSCIATVNDAASVKVSSDRLYDRLAELGVSYGPTFRGLTNCHVGEDCSRADLLTPDVAQEMPNHHITDAVVQPAFIESLISLYWPIADRGEDALDTVFLPSSVERVTISSHASEATTTPGQTLQAFCHGSVPSHGSTPIKVNMFVQSVSKPMEPLIMLDGLVASPILDNEARAEETHRELCYKLEWEPILEHVASTVNGSAQTATENGGLSKPLDCEIAIIHAQGESQMRLTRDLAEALEEDLGKKPDRGTIFTVEPEGKLCIVLVELDRPLLANMKADAFSALQKTLTTARGVLWVVRGAYDHATSPDLNMITGISRTIRSETLLPFATLDLDGKSAHSSAEVVHAVMKVFDSVFCAAVASGEMEFMERSGQFYTPRVVEDAETNEIVHVETHSTSLRPSLFAEAGRPLRLISSETGALESLHFTDDTLKSSLGDNDIEIQIRAIGVNEADLATAHRQATFGSEASGIVTGVGSAVAKYSLGDRVVAFLPRGGAFANRIRAPAKFVFKLPATLSFEAGASLPFAYGTAYYGLVELGRLREDETVLIHWAAGAVGQAAVILAQMVGAEIFATVSNGEEKDVLMNEHHIQEDHIFYSLSKAFGASVKCAAGGSGVDVILNCAASEAVRHSWDCLGKFGRLIDVGTRDLKSSITKLEMGVFGHNASFASVDFMTLATEKPKVVQRVMADVAKLVVYHKVRPVSPLVSFSISEAAAALKMLQGGRACGKIIVVPRPDDTVMVSDPGR